MPIPHENLRDLKPLFEYSASTQFVYLIHVIVDDFGQSVTTMLCSSPNRYAQIVHLDRQCTRMLVGDECIVKFYTALQY